MDGEHAFLYFLRRITSTATVNELIKEFGSEKTKLPRCFWWMVRDIHRRFKNLLSDFSPACVARFPMYAKAICEEANKAKRLEGDDFDPNDFAIALFIDCNLVKTCRPGAGPARPGPGAERRDPSGDVQRSAYNGWARAHGG